MSCKYCCGKKVLYQRTINTKLYINKARTLETETMSCPPFVNCSMKDIPTRSAFIINYCPSCGKPLTAPHKYTLEELREMDGRPIFIVDEWHHWDIVQYIEDPNEPYAKLGLYEGWLYLFDYGKTWLAYDRPLEEELWQ